MPAPMYFDVPSDYIDPTPGHPPKCKCQPCQDKRRLLRDYRNRLKYHANREAILKRRAEIHDARSDEEKAILKEKTKQRSSKSWEKNKEKIKEKRANRSPEEQEAYLQYLRDYRKENHEELSAKARQSRRDDPERFRETSRRSRIKHADRVAARQHDYYMNNQERLLEYAKDFRDNRMHDLYKIWEGMIQRCTNPNNKMYPHYGGRGIRVCDRWRSSFWNFVDDMGSRPSHFHSIERVDVNGHYEPSNCTWATAKEQMNNTRRQLRAKAKKLFDEHDLVRFRDHVMHLMELSDITGIPPIIVKYRYLQNKDPEWILESDNNLRFYPYQDHLYSLDEIHLMTGIEYATVFDRLVRLKMTVEELVSEE